MSIKIGNIDISYFKVGGADCSIYLGSEKLYPTTPPTPHDYSQDYLTFRALEDGTFSFSGSGAISANTLEYSVDSGSTWSTLQNSGTTPTVTSGNTILWKASGLTIDANNGIGTFSSTSQFEAEGNIMSLLFGDNFSGQTDLTGYDSAFRGLFSKCITITSAENLILPATTLTKTCYMSMFNGCTSLTTAPELPAATLADNCYMSMFYGCTSLTTAPEIPASTLAERCYGSMFYGCVNLTTAPSVLPATTLANNCYNGMFNGCTSLTTAPDLSATTLASGCCKNMFAGCTSLTTAPELPAVTMEKECYSSMFDNCTSLATAPELPATTLAEKCYSFMFYGCVNLTTAPSVLPATTLATNCYSNMFYNCTSLTTAPELPATTLANNCYNGMFSGCTSLSAITCLATDISAGGCTLNWVRGVAASGTFTKAASMTSWTTGNKGIPSGWTVVDYSG